MSHMAILTCARWRNEVCLRSDWTKRLTALKKKNKKQLDLSMSFLSIVNIINYYSSKALWISNDSSFAK